MGLRAILTVIACLVLSDVALAQDKALPDYVIETFGHPPAVPTGALPADVADALEQVVTHAVAQSDWDIADTAHFDVLAASADPRIAWIMRDMMRFSWRPEFRAAVTDVAVAVTGVKLDTIRHGHEIADHLLAWDIPAFPGYLAHKRAVFTNYIPGWDRILVEGDIAWEMVSWGGVNIDDRPYGQTDEICACIPAIDDPALTDVAGAAWLADDAVVFGIVLNGEARAYPRRIMEVREMVNDTLGGRDLGIPYCTLCGAAQAFLTDAVPVGFERPILRTSGLLIRSNKVMYDVNTFSVFDTFRGVGVTGPMTGVVLPQVTVITTTWGEWKTAHPETTVLIEADALGRDYNLRETRDKAGPIFPVGDVDPRLPVHEDVVGVLTADGQSVAFSRASAFAALTAGQEVQLHGIHLERVAGGLRAKDAVGRDIPSHQAFWFAWSQFHPDTALWDG